MVTRTASYSTKNDSHKCFQCQKAELSLNVHEQGDFHYKSQQIFLVQSSFPQWILMQTNFISDLHFLSQRDIAPLGTCDLFHIMKRKEYLEHHIIRKKVA